jgi:hypothetical protein
MRAASQMNTNVSGTKGTIATTFKVSYQFDWKIEAKETQVGEILNQKKMGSVYITDAEQLACYPRSGLTVL